jgi:PAP2 superfamily
VKDLVIRTVPKVLPAATSAFGAFVAYARDVAKNGIFISLLSFALIALVWKPDTYLQLFGHYSQLVLGINFIVIVMLVIRGIVLFPLAPLSGLIDGVRKLTLEHVAMIPLVILFLSAYTTLKVNIPNLAPYYADPLLATIDHWLHGDDPWKYARMAPAETSIVIDFVYSKLWFAVALFSLVHAAVLRPGPEFKRLAMASLLVYIVLGFILATALSSVGPIFYDRFYPEPRFMEFTAMLATDVYATQQKLFVDYLYTAATTNTALIGTGISAAPSIHVGVAVIAAWYMTSQGRISMIVGWCFAATILFGSVYTGWHYAVDGYLSAIAATLFWWMASRRSGLGMTTGRQGPKSLGDGAKI